MKLDSASTDIAMAVACVRCANSNCDGAQNQFKNSNDSLAKGGGLLFFSFEFRVCVFHVFVLILPRRRFDLLLIQLLELAESRLVRLMATAVSRLLASRHFSFGRDGAEIVGTSRADRCFATTSRTLFDALRLVGGEEDLDAGANASPALVIVAIVQEFVEFVVVGARVNVDAVNQLIAATTATTTTRRRRRRRRRCHSCRGHIRCTTLTSAMTGAD